MTLSAQAETDEAWLRERLGRRFLGVRPDKHDGWWAEALSRREKPIGWWGKTEGEALAKMRRTVEGR